MVLKPSDVAPYSAVLIAEMLEEAGVPKGVFNLVHGDALKMQAHDGKPITFAEWGYLGKGKFQRRDFRLDNLTMASAFSEEGNLFADLGKHEIFTPTKTYPAMTIGELAALSPRVLV